jgi:hypothetical protein
VEENDLIGVLIGSRLEPLDCFIIFADSQLQFSNIVRRDILSGCALA